jgi:hypothetical protein
VDTFIILHTKEFKIAFTIWNLLDTFFVLWWNLLHKTGQNSFLPYFPYNPKANTTLWQYMHLEWKIQLVVKLFIFWLVFSRRQFSKIYPQSFKAISVIYTVQSSSIKWNATISARVYDFSLFLRIQKAK